MNTVAIWVVFYFLIHGYWDHRKYKARLAQSFVRLTE
jgi:hypothetical protein